MSNLFLDIETVPLSVPEGADAEAIKKLSLSACTDGVLCLGYAIGGHEAETLTPSSIIPAKSVKSSIGVVWAGRGGEKSR